MAVWRLLQQSRQAMMVACSRVAGSEKTSKFGYILRKEPTGFADRLDVV